MFHMQRQRRLAEEHARFYSAEISLALNFLHEKGRMLNVPFNEASCRVTSGIACRLVATLLLLLCFFLPLYGIKIINVRQSGLLMMNKAC